MSWWGRRGSGYSSGPVRSEPLAYAEAEALFARARDPDLGKPMPGKAVRLWKEPSGSFSLTYQDTPVVEIHPDGTYTLMHGNYPTKMTAQRMNEHAPVDVEVLGTRRTEESAEGYTFYMWDDLQLIWKTSPPEAHQRADLFMQFYPDQYTAAYHHTMPFPRDQIRVDNTGRPILSDLLSEIAPDSWAYAAGGKLQPWARSEPGYIDWSEPIAPRDLGREPDQWEAIAQQMPVLVRRSWFNTPAALIWWVRPIDGPDHYRWAVKDLRSRATRSGAERDLDLAMADATAALHEMGWERGAPRLADLLGPLSSQLGRVPSPEELMLPLPTNERLLGLSVKRVHWMEPWTTTRNVRIPGAGTLGYHPSAILPRLPLPGSRAWSGETGNLIDVRLWFEVDGHGVALSNYKGKERVLVHRLGTSAETAWDIDGIVATGLVAAVLAWLGGLFA